MHNCYIDSVPRFNEAAEFFRTELACAEIRCLHDDEGGFHAHR